MNKKFQLADLLTDFALLMAIASSLFASDLAYCQDNPSYRLAKEYVREVGELEGLRASAEQVLKKPGSNTLTESLYFSTRITTALRSDIAVLEEIKLSGQLADLPGLLALVHQDKIGVHNGLIEVATTMLSGPKPGVDYGQVASRAPQLRAQLDALDEQLFKFSVLVFGGLIDAKPDKDGHMSRLSITEMERADLLADIRRTFGAKLDQKNQSYYVSGASVLEHYLKDKGYKCVDESQ